MRGCKEDGETRFSMRPRVSVQKALAALVGLKIKAYPSEKGAWEFCLCLVHKADIPDFPKDINKFWLQFW